MLMDASAAVTYVVAIATTVMLSFRLSSKLIFPMIKRVLKTLSFVVYEYREKIIVSLIVNLLPIQYVWQTSHFQLKTEIPN